MKISYDPKAKIASIGLVPWTRLGLERWFDSYKIASLYGWDMEGVADAPQVIALSDRLEKTPVLERMNTPHLLANIDFQNLLKDEFSGYSFMTYKPVVSPKALTTAGLSFISGDTELAARLENKAEFRNLFPDLPFPPYTVFDRDALRADDKTLATLMDGFSCVVLQDEKLSGAKGTFIIKDLADLQCALDSLSQLAQAGRRVIVSEFIEDARERSVQGCVTKYGTLVGPLQKQIIAHPMLANLHANASRFCGGEIDPEDPLLNRRTEIEAYARRIGDKITQMGYKGIFGLDCLIDKDGALYILEINPRITGMTSLLTALYRDGQDIPFYLLHVLELSCLDYELTDFAVDPIPAPGSILLLHALASHNTHIHQSLDSGAYNVDGEFITKAFRLDLSSEAEQIVLQSQRPSGFEVRPGDRVASILSNRLVLDISDELSEESIQCITKLQKQVTLGE